MPVKKDDHSLDELRYYVMTKPKKDKPEAEKSEILKEKERLIRRIASKNKIGGGYGYK